MSGDGAPDPERDDADARAREPVPPVPAPPAFPPWPSAVEDAGAPSWPAPPRIAAPESAAAEPTPSSPLDALASTPHEAGRNGAARPWEAFAGLGAAPPPGDEMPAGLSSARTSAAGDEPGAPFLVPETPAAPPDSAVSATAADAEGLGAHGHRSALGALRDNLEAVAFALILALLLRHCAVEVFKIPTASMQPTLWGDRENGDIPGDRILVDKSAYLLRDPARWEILVFRYPLDWSRNFIKRCAVLPDEWFRIERGDVWVGRSDDDEEPALHPARKPRTVREQLYTAAYPAPPSPWSTSPGPEPWQPSADGPRGWTVESRGRLVFAGDGPLSGGGPSGPAELATIEFTSPIKDAPEGGGFLVPDIRLRARVTADASAEFEISWSPGDGRRHALRVATADRGGSSTSTATKTARLPRPLVAGKAMDLELESVDGDLRAWIDGDELAVIADEIPLEEAIRVQGLGEGGPRPRLVLGARGGRVVAADVRVDHDLYYTNYLEGGGVPAAGKSLHLGPDEFFMLGDNTRHSSDSRKWNASGVRLKDGREIYWDPQPSQGCPPNPRYVTVDGKSLKEVTDVEGVVRRFSAEEEDDRSLSKRVPFVKRERIVGRAWFALVFWPPREILPRVRFVH